jgi:hypothetical protein
MSEYVISIGFINKTGHIERESESYSPSEFGGFVPSVGERIFDPYTVRHKGEKPIDARRTFWIVEERIFLPYIPACILVCRDDPATDRYNNILKFE